MGRLSYDAAVRAAYPGPFIVDFAAAVWTLIHG